MMEGHSKVAVAGEGKPSVFKVGGRRGGCKFIIDGCGTLSFISAVEVLASCPKPLSGALELTS
jgi:hypothetical protein